MDSIITTNQNIVGQKDSQNTFSVRPYETAPSLICQKLSAVSIALRFSTPECQWSDKLFINNINDSTDNKKCSFIKSEFTNLKIL